MVDVGDGREMRRKKEKGEQRVFGAEVVRLIQAEEGTELIIEVSDGEMC